MPQFLFLHGPLPGLQRRIGLSNQAGTHNLRNAAFVLVLTWVPLGILSAFQQIANNDGTLRVFFRDFGVIARFVVAAPLLVAAETWCFRRLSKVVDRFFDANLLETEEAQMKLREGVASTRRLSASTAADVVIVLVAYALTALLYFHWPVEQFPHWYGRADRGRLAFTLAGNWQAYVSLPLLFVLLLTWIWRQILWCRILLVIARLQPRLIAAHPDSAGGLTFMNGSMRGYWPIAFAFASIAAGAVANQLQAGSSLYDARYLMIGVLTFVLALFATPFVVFVPNLLRLKESLIFEYSALGNAVGDQFEEKLLKRRREVTSDALELQAFSATTDLYSIVGNCYKTHYYPITFASMRELSIATMLPFVPVALSVIPFDHILHAAGQMLT